MITNWFDDLVGTYDKPKKDSFFAWFYWTFVNALTIAIFIFAVYGFLKYQGL